MTDETLRRSDELLTELIETVETARALPMSASCVLPRERLLDLLDELREVLPPDMEKARTVIATRDRLLKDAHEQASAAREKSVAEADTVLRDAGHHADQLVADAEQRAREAVAAGQAEQADLVAATSVHQAAAEAAAVLRAEAESYHEQISDEARRYDTRLRTEADRYAHEARGEAERYATKLTADAEDYAEKTLDELSAVLHRAATTADQGRSAIAARRVTEWSATHSVDTGSDEDAVPHPGADRLTA